MGRVLLPTDPAQRDDVVEMVAVARALNPERRGLDIPAWNIGRHCVTTGSDSGGEFVSQVPCASRRREAHERLSQKSP